MPQERHKCLLGLGINGVQRPKASPAILKLWQLVLALSLLSLQAASYKKAVISHTWVQLSVGISSDDKITSTWAARAFATCSDAAKKVFLLLVRKFATRTESVQSVFCSFTMIICDRNVPGKLGRLQEPASQRHTL